MLPRHRNRAEHAFREFLWLPLLVVAVSLAAAALTISLDRVSPGPVTAGRQGLAVLIVPGSVSTFLQTLTSGLITIVSIIFFVLLMVVNQQTGKYTPAVLEQFLRRRINQVFFGLFVGLSLYGLLAIVLVPSGQAILSATVLLVFTGVALILLLVMIYATLDQLRPTAMVWMLQRLALRARDQNLPLRTRCQDSPRLPEAEIVTATAEQAGYVVHIDGRRLARACDRVRGPVQIEFREGMGSHLVAGTAIATIRGGDTDERDELARGVLEAVTLGRFPDIDRDAGYAVEQLGSMAWSASSAGQDPDGAMAALRGLHGLLGRWSSEQLPPPDGYGGSLPIIYRDGVVDKILDTLTGVVTATRQSGQHQTHAQVLEIIAEALPQLSAEHQQIAIDRLHRVLPTTAGQVMTVELSQAFHALHEALYTAAFFADADRINELTNTLAEQHRLAPPADPSG